MDANPYQAPQATADAHGEPPRRVSAVDRVGTLLVLGGIVVFTVAAIFIPIEPPVTPFQRTVAQICWVAGEGWVFTFLLWVLWKLQSLRWSAAKDDRYDAPIDSNGG